MVDRLANSEANHRRIMMVESAFGSAGESLQKTGRVLVGEGVLTKICRKKPKPRQFFLFNDVLVYGNIVLDKKKYNKQHVLMLADVSLSSLDDDGELKYGWQIISPIKSFAVFAATATEKAEWMAHINKCITDLRKKSGIEGPAAEGAAVWVPDSNATLCMVCQKTKFSAINRRHHCRKCGILVCGNCSKNKWLLPQICAKPVRICARCYASLRSSPESADTATAPTSSPEAAEAVESRESTAPPPQEDVRASVLDVLPEPPPPVELLSDEDLPAGDPSRLSQIEKKPRKPGGGGDSSDDDSTARSESMVGKAGSSDEDDDDDDPKQATQQPSVFFDTDAGDEKVVAEEKAATEDGQNDADNDGL